MIVNAKQAATKATEYFSTLYAGKAISNVQLEEVEITDDGKFWLITLSYPASDLAEILGRGGPKEYKVFKIDAETDEVKSMKIRKVG